MLGGDLVVWICLLLIMTIFPAKLLYYWLLTNFEFFEVPNYPLLPELIARDPSLSAWCHQHRLTSHSPRQREQPAMSPTTQAIEKDPNKSPGDNLLRNSGLYLESASESEFVVFPGRRLGYWLIEAEVLTLVMIKVIWNREDYQMLLWSLLR